MLKKFIAFTIILSTVAGNINFVYANNSNEFDDYFEIKSSDNYVTSYASNDNETDKKKIETILEDKMNSPKIDRRGYQIRLSGKGASSYKGDLVRAEFSTSFSIKDAIKCTASIYGSSKDYWNGLTPQIATSIDSRDEFVFNTVGSSISVSGSPSFGFKSGKDIYILEYPTLNNDFVYYHDYAGIKVSALFMINVRQNHSNTFLFGNQTISSFATDSSVIW